MGYALTYNTSVLKEYPTASMHEPEIENLFLKSTAALTAGFLTICYLCLFHFQLGSSVSFFAGEGSFSRFELNELI